MHETRCWRAFAHLERLPERWNTWLGWEGSKSEWRSQNPPLRNWRPPGLERMRFCGETHLHKRYPFRTGNDLIKLQRTPRSEIHRHRHTKLTSFASSTYAAN